MGPQASRTSSEYVGVLFGRSRNPGAVYVWQADALCLEHPEVSWFDGDQAAAEAVCASCLVRREWAWLMPSRTARSACGAAQPNVNGPGCGARLPEV